MQQWFTIAVDLSETGPPATGAWALPLQQIAAKNAGSWVCGLADSASTIPITADGALEDGVLLQHVARTTAGALWVSPQGRSGLPSNSANVGATVRCCDDIPALTLIGHASPTSTDGVPSCSIPCATPVDAACVESSDSGTNTLLVGGIGAVGWPSSDKTKSSGPGE